MPSGRRPGASRRSAATGRPGAGGPGGRGRRRTLSSGEVERVGVADLEARRPRRPSRVGPRRRERRLRRGRRRRPGRVPRAGQVDGDRARAAADVEQVLPRSAGAAAGTPRSSRPSAIDASAGRSRGGRACRSRPGRTRRSARRGSRRRGSRGAGDDDGLADAPPDGIAPGFGSAATAAVARVSSPDSMSNTTSSWTYR